MAITKSDGLYIAAAFCEALAEALDDPSTPEVVTKEEWMAIAQKVAVEAFTQLSD